MASKYNPIIQQNASWEITITLKDSALVPINIQGWTGQCQIRATYASSTVLSSPTVTITDGVNGILTVSLTKSQTALLSATPRQPTEKSPLPVWDVLLSNSDNTITYRILEGQVTVLPGVTKWAI